MRLHLAARGCDGISHLSPTDLRLTAPPPAAGEAARRILLSARLPAAREAETHRHVSGRVFKTCVSIPALWSVMLNQCLGRLELG